MENLTAEQASNLAKEFLSLEEAIADYRFVQRQKLSVKADAQLEKLQETLMINGQDLLADSTNLMMKDVSSSLEKISGITEGIKKSIRKITRVQDVIDLLAQTVSLASAVISRNPQAISKAISALEAKI
jgi:ABC-type transporter Mla subunit MlaD